MEFSHDLALSMVQSDVEFPVDFDNAWQWIGYANKQAAKKKLTRNFEEGKDYSSKWMSVPHSKGSSASRTENIRLTVDCFKSLGMMAGTDKGKQIRRYFLDCERQLKQHPAPNADRSLVGEINTLYGRMEAEAERVKHDHLQIAKQIGDRLLQLKATLKHGQWAQFRALHIKSPRTGLPMPSSTATLFQRISKQWEALQAAEVETVREAQQLLRRWVSTQQPKLLPAAKPPAEHALVVLTRSLIATGCTPDIAVQQAATVLVSEERLVIRTETTEEEA